MIKLSDLISSLEPYVEGHVDLETWYNQALLSFQSLTEHASDDDLDVLSEILAGLYEVQDGVLDEEIYREALRELLLVGVRPQTITVGDDFTDTYQQSPLSGTSTNAEDTALAMTLT